jgi:hypothetical protein
MVVMGVLMAPGLAQAQNFAVDTPLGTTPVGTLGLAIRDDALSTLTPVEGDAIALRVGAQGALWTALVDAAGAQITSFGGGTQYSEDTAHASGDTMTMAGVVQSAACGTALSTNADRSLLQTDSVGNLCVTGAGGGTQYAVDAALGATPTGTLTLFKRDDALSALTPVEADAIEGRVDGFGAIWTVLSSGGVALGATNPISVRLTDGTSYVAPSTVDTEDASIAAGQSNISPVVPLTYYYNGTAWVRSTGDPCTYAVKTYYPVDIVTIATTEVINGAGASNYIYICSVNLVTAAANNVAIVEDDTDACASITAGLNGGTTAGEGWNFAANGGIALGNGGSTVMKSAGTNRYLCIVTSAAVQLSGTIAYVAAP